VGAMRSLFVLTTKMEVAFISKFSNQKPNRQEDPVNEKIRFKEVLVIDQDGEQLGIKSKFEALDIAYDQNLDLVCVAPNAKPPVCRIMDYGKYRFEQQKKVKEMKKNSKVVSLKETQLSVTIDTHDKNVKLKRTLKWLQDGDKVKIAIRFRGRQLAHVDLGEKILKDFVAECEEFCVVEKPAKMEGRTLTAILAPKKK
jgi:bacterial translation initiation factor 3 (bIF-3)